jgi:hypothetical protein
MSKHTPGPWNVGHEDENTGEIEVISDGRPYVCLVLPGAIDEVTPANARLIAAAPELLEALQRLDKNGHTQATWEFALRAIAKATGEA